jgi:hypothetical protein
VAAATVARIDAREEDLGLDRRGPSESPVREGRRGAQKFLLNGRASKSNYFYIIKTHT